MTEFLLGLWLGALLMSAFFLWALWSGRITLSGPNQEPPK